MPTLESMRRYVDELERIGWADVATRALFIEFALLNGATGALMSGRAAFEVTSGGGVVPIHRFTVIQPRFPTGWVELLLATVFLFITVVLTIATFNDIVLELLHERRKKRKRTEETDTEMMSADSSYAAAATAEVDRVAFQRLELRELARARVHLSLIHI